MTSAYLVSPMYSPHSCAVGALELPLPGLHKLTIFGRLPFVFQFT
jgi:hypothetical protein